MFCKSLVKYDVSNQRSLKLLSQSHFISSPKFRIFSYGTFHSIKSYAEIENGCQFPKISREEWESILRYFRKKARRKFLIGNFSSILRTFLSNFRNCDSLFRNSIFSGFSGNLPRKFPYQLFPFRKCRNLCLNTYGKCPLLRYEKGADASKLFIEIRVC